MAASGKGAGTLCPARRIAGGTGPWRGDLAQRAPLVQSRGPRDGATGGPKPWACLPAAGSWSSHRVPPTWGNCSSRGCSRALSGGPFTEQAGGNTACLPAGPRAIGVRGEARVGSAGSWAPGPQGSRARGVHVAGACFLCAPTTWQGTRSPARPVTRRPWQGWLAGPLQPLVEVLLSGSPELFGQMDRTDRLLPSHQGWPTPSPQGS